MASELLKVADAVVSELNGAALSMAFTAARHYQPSFDLCEMKELHVSVVPKGIEVSQAGRNTGSFDYKIDIGVQRKYAEESAAELDPLMALVEEIAELFRFKRLARLPEAAWIKTEHACVFAQEHMRELRQFTSVLTLTFRVVR